MPAAALSPRAAITRAAAMRCALRHARHAMMRVTCRRAHAVTFDYATRTLLIICPTRRRCRHDVSFFYAAMPPPPLFSRRPLRPSAPLIYHTFRHAAMPCR